MKAIDAITELKSLGYAVSIEGNTIRVMYEGEGDPPRKKAIPLLRALKIQKKNGWRPEGTRGTVMVEEGEDEILLKTDTPENQEFEKAQRRVLKEANEAIRKGIKEDYGIELTDKTRPMIPRLCPGCNKMITTWDAHCRYCGCSVYPLLVKLEGVDKGKG